jgi:hypothetical protein
MSATPTPEEYAFEYAACRRRIRDLLTPVLADRARSEAASATVVPACPDWTVEDLGAHLAGVARDLVERRNPGADTQSWVDGQVLERRGRGIAAQLDEWDEFGPGFEALIVRVPRAFAGLLLDVVAHEHDLAHTLGLPADRTTNGLRVAMFTEAELLSRDLVAHGLPAVRVAAGREEWVCGAGEVQVTLDLGNGPTAIWELTRVLGSRRSHAQMSVLPWQGDWERFLPGLAHMSLPTTDLVE